MGDEKNMSFSERSKVALDCLPASPFKDQLSMLHSEIIKENQEIKGSLPHLNKLLAKHSRDAGMYKGLLDGLLSQSRDVGGAWQVDSDVFLKVRAAFNVVDDVPAGQVE